MKSNEKTRLLFLALCLAAVTLFCAGCKKDSGWKAQSAQNTGSSAESGDETSAKSSRPTSIKVSSFLHDLFGGELPEDTDRFLLPEIGERQDFTFERTVFDGDVYGNTLYFIEYQVSKIYAYDLGTGETRVFTEDIGNPVKLCTDSDGVYVADVRSNEIVYFTFDGARAGAVPLPEKPYANGDENTGWMLEKYVSGLRHYDGLLLLAAKESVWTIRDGDTQWQRADVPLMRYETVKDASILSRDRIAVYTSRNAVGDVPANRVTEMDLTGGHTKLLCEDQTNALTAAEGKLFRASHVNGVVRLYEISTGVSAYMQSLSLPDGMGMGTVNRMAVSGKTVFILWSGKKASLIPIPDGWDSVRIIAPESESMRMEEISECAESVPVRFDLYGDEVYFDKLNAALLSGESDFDIALVSGSQEDVTTLLRAILKNKSYADMNANPDLSANMQEAYPGVNELLELDGELAILPLGFGGVWTGFTELAVTCGIPLPHANWNLNDLDAYAEAVIQSGEPLGLFPETDGQRTEIILSMALSVVQGNTNLLRDEAGTDAEENLRQLFDSLTKYRTEGILSHKNALFTVVASEWLRPLNGMENASLALTPSAVAGNAPGKAGRSSAAFAGKHPAEVVSFLFVNPKSERIVQALSLLADLTNEDSRYNSRIYQTPLFPDVAKYYRNDDIREDPATGKAVLDPHREQAVPEELMPFARNMDDFFGTYYSGSELCLLTVTDKAREAVSDFCAGKLSGEECAKILFNEFVYKLKG